MLSIPVQLNELTLLRRHTAGTVDRDLAAAQDDASLALAATFLVFVAIAMVLLVWLSRARGNVDAYGPGRQRYGRGWAVGGWFIPIVNLVVPYRVTADVLAGSDTGTNNGTASGSGLLRLWWAAWLISGGFDLAASLRTAVDGGILLNVVGRVTEAVAAILLLLVVRRITAAQQLREHALGWTLRATASAD